MKQNDIKIQIDKFEKNKTSLYHRYYSFDFCYNYFYKKQNSGIDLEKDCLQLGYYLASWGMLRGSSFLLQTNLAHYKKVIKFINSLDKQDWDIDIDNYENNLDRIVDIYNGIKDCIMPPKADNNHLVLVSKIMLGTLGIVPAYDRYVSQSIKNIYNGDKFNINTLNTTKNFNKKYKGSLEFLNKFYNANKVDFDTVSIRTKEFGSEKDSKLKYTKAKILDMYLFAKSLL